MSRSHYKHADGAWFRISNMHFVRCWFWFAKKFGVWSRFCLWWRVRRRLLCAMRSIGFTLLLFFFASVASSAQTPLLRDPDLLELESILGEWGRVQIEPGVIRDNPPHHLGGVIREPWRLINGLNRLTHGINLSLTLFSVESSHFRLTTGTFYYL